jgi:hypothetical protein
MGSPSRQRSPRKWRVVVRGIVTLVIAVGTVLTLTETAHAEPFTVEATPGDLVGACRSLGGALFVSNDGAIGACLYEGGDIICDFEKEGENCTVDAERKFGVLAEQIPELRDRESREEHSVPDPKDWRQKVSVADLTAVVCVGIEGQGVVSDDGTFGACSTPNATFVCYDEESGKNCLGVADSKKHAVSTRKRIRTLLDANAETPAGPNQGPTNTSPTTSSSTTTSTSQPDTTTSSPEPSFL